MEQIFCRNCGTEHNIVRATECEECHEVVFTKAELLAQIREKSARVNTLNAEIAVARSELWHRTHRSGGLYVWEQPRPVLITEKQRQTKPVISVTELAEFN